MKYFTKSKEAETSREPIIVNICYHQLEDVYVQRK